MPIVSSKNVVTISYMGAGKGKSRRAQVGVKVIEKSTVQTWEDFIARQGIEGITLTEYYLPDARSPLGVEEEKRLLNELLADMREMGTFQFQSGIDPEKVEVMVSSDYGEEVLVLKERGRMGEVIIFSSARERMPLISEETSMGSLNAFNLVQKLGEARWELDRAWFEHVRMFGEPPHTHSEDWDG